MTRGNSCVTLTPLSRRNARSRWSSISTQWSGETTTSRAGIPGAIAPARMRTGAASTGSGCAARSSTRRPTQRTVSMLRRPCGSSATTRTLAVLRGQTRAGGKAHDLRRGDERVADGVDRDVGEHEVGDVEIDGSADAVGQRQRGAGVEAVSGGEAFDLDRA